MSEYAAFVGWDWAHKEHVIELWDSEMGTTEKSRVEGKPEALHDWAAKMRQRYGGRKIAVCIENSKGAVIWAFMRYDHIALFPVNPRCTASFRNTFFLSGKKDDPVDASIACELVRKHHEKLRVFEPADAATRALGMLSEKRRKLVGEKTRLTNQLGENLKMYYPQALDLAGDLDTPLSCDFLETWPSLGAARRARAETLRKFYRTHRSRSEERIEQRIELLRTTVALTDDPAVLECGAIITRALVTAVRGVLAAIELLDQELARIYRAHPEHDQIDSLPGVGDVMGPRLIAILGVDRDRFHDAKELQQLTGIAPVTSSTGGRNGPVRISRRLKRSKFLHQTIVEWAGCALGNSAWVDAYYAQQKEAGKTHWVILRSLGFKLLRIVYRCWKTRTHYDEMHHQEELKKRRSSLAARLVA